MFITVIYTANNVHHSNLNCAYMDIRSNGWVFLVPTRDSTKLTILNMFNQHSHNKHSQLSKVNTNTACRYSTATCNQFSIVKWS